MVDGWSKVIRSHDVDNFDKILGCFVCGDEFWFCELQERSGIKSVTYFRGSLFRLVRLGVLFEVCKGKYGIDRGFVWVVKK